MSTLDQAMNYLADTFASDDWHILTAGCRYRKVAGIVYILAYVTGNSFSTSYKIIGTLPSGYRPIVTVYTVCGFSNGGQGIAYVSEPGKVGIKTDSGTAPNVWFCMSYPADQ